MRNIILSDEQQKVIKFAKTGKNILVNACIGSGKTTTIQHLCNVLYNKKILYLTYSRLLKLDAQDKIKYRNTTVNNYHGYGYCILKAIGVHASTDDILNKFNELKPVLPKYDILILDEYQDINENIALMLEHIKHQSGDNLQIVAVGDMDQKIYNSTLEDKILYTTYLDTNLDRYLTQVQITISIDTEYFFCYNIKNIKNGVVLI